MIVITTPTGHIGSKILSELIGSDEKLRVIARDPSKLSDEARDKVEIVVGSLDDPETVSKAYEGAEQLFFNVPPGMDYADVNEYYLRFGKITCDAIDRHKVKQVAYVSGTGLGHEKHAGGVSASFLVEELLVSTTAATRILHCGTFMENLMHAIQPIKFKGEYGTPVPGDTKLPWVATQDIADVATRLLLDKTWTGKASVGVLGPEDLSYGELTAIMSEVLEKEIQYKAIAPETLIATLTQYGASEAAAQSLAEIYASMKNGVFNMIERTPESSSPTKFRQWCEDVFKPAVLN